MSCFNSIVKNYRQTTETSVVSRFIHDPSLLSIIGPVENLEILDLGCGYGRYSIILAENNKCDVLGIDISTEMIETANKIKNEAMITNVNFEVGDAENLNLEVKFDLVLANFVLNFSETTDQLLKICKSLYKCLKPGGRAVGFVPNGDSMIKFSKEDGMKYGICFTIADDVKDEQEIPVIFFNKSGVEIAKASMKWYYRSTYEHCFKVAGFHNFIWHSPWVSKEGIDIKGETFWHNWMNPPKDIIFEAKKN